MRNIINSWKYENNKSKFICDEIDGHKVYSLPDIMAMTDKHGYHNNIICICAYDCNCRSSICRYQQP